MKIEIYLGNWFGYTIQREGREEWTVQWRWKIFE